MGNEKVQLLGALMAQNWKEFDYSEWKAEDAKYNHEAHNKYIETCMKAGTLKDLLDIFDKSLDHPPWKPHVSYNKHGDILDIVLSNEAYCAKQITPQIHVLLSSETEEIVGIQIWGASKVSTDWNIPL